MKRRLRMVCGLAALLGEVALGSVTMLNRGSASTDAHARALDANGVATEGLDAAQGDIARGALILDVRKDDEWGAGRVAGSVHIPLAEVQDRMSELPKGRMIVTVCKDGGRSYKAAYALRQAGYDAVNLDGGLTAWAAAGLPLVDEVGAPGRID
jgi:rhodanese-related sulfurtransferase